MLASLRSFSTKLNVCNTACACRPQERPGCCVQQAVDGLRSPEYCKLYSDPCKCMAASRTHRSCASLLLPDRVLVLMQCCCCEAIQGHHCGACWPALRTNHHTVWRLIMFSLQRFYGCHWKGACTVAGRQRSGRALPIKSQGWVLAFVL